MTSSAAPAHLRPTVILRSWDADRSVAYATGDLAALRRLYVPRSTAGRADVRLLRSYLARGLRVENLRVQLLSVEVRQRWPDGLWLRVVERLARAEAVDVESDTRQLLPRDRASERIVELRRSASGDWRVASVSG